MAFRKMPPTSFRLLAAAIVLLQASASAQQSPSSGPSEQSERPAFRDLSGYRFPPPVRTVRDMQNVAQAILLRDYCADERVPDDFVKRQLERFSRITGRAESCRTLLDY